MYEGLNHHPEDASDEIPDEEFIRRNVIEHQKVELSEEEESFLSKQLVEFEGGDKETVEFEFSDVIFRCDYKKFNYAFNTNDQKNVGGREGLISLELSQRGTGEDDLNNLYQIEGAVLISKTDGHKYNLLENLKVLGIVFSGSDVKGTSAINPLSKIIFISGPITNIENLLAFMHEIGHEVTARMRGNKIEMIKAVATIMGKRRDQDMTRSVRLYLENEIDASDYAFKIFEDMSSDEEFLKLAKRRFGKSLSSHVERVKKKMGKKTN